VVGWLLHPGSTDRYTEICVYVAQGLMREVVVVLPEDEEVGEGRSLLQVRRRRRTCTDKVRSHRAAAATIHFSCVHYITTYYNNIPLQFDYCDTRICAQDVTRSENITNECTL